MFNLKSAFRLAKITPKYIEDIPPQFLSTKEEMQNDVMKDYMQPDSDMSWDELCSQMEMIEGWYNDDENNGDTQ